jgi:hypothetical protein
MIFSWGLSRVSGSIFSAYQIATNLIITIKIRMLTELPGKNYIIKEILAMHAVRPSASRKHYLLHRLVPLQQ